MKTKDQIRNEAFSKIQELLTFADPDDAFGALDTLAMMVQCSAESLAGACSVGQAALGLRDMAKYLEAAPNLPKIHFTAKLH